MLIFSKPSFLMPSLGLFVCIGLINTTTRLALCALCFVTSVLLTYALSELHGYKKAMLTLRVCILTNAILAFTRLSPALAIYSDWPKAIVNICFISAALSIWISTLVYEKLRLANLYVRNVTSLSLASIVDSSIVVFSLCYLGKFSLEQAGLVYTKDLAFKLMYSLIASGIVASLSQPSAREGQVI